MTCYWKALPFSTTTIVVIVEEVVVVLVVVVAVVVVVVVVVVAQSVQSALVLRLFASTLQANLQHFLICAFSFSV